MFLSSSDPKMQDHIKTCRERARTLFQSHAIDEDGAKLMGIVRDNYEALGVLLLMSTPTGRGQSLALTHLEDSLMWANKAITAKYPVLKPAASLVTPDSPPPDSL